LLDWLATCRLLHRQNTALTLTDARGAGKTMLADGIARLWHEAGATDLDKVLGARFNGAMMSCPLLFGDEELTTGNLRGDAAAGIRSLLGASNFTIERKGQEVSALEGSPRIIIAANNLDAILSVFRSELSETEDREAVRDRLLHIPVGPAAREFLQIKGGYAFTSDWVTGDVIARHVLWLEQTRKVKPGPRFMVPGNLDATRAMGLFNEKTSRVIEFLVRYLSEPFNQTFNGRAAIDGIKCGRGELWANASAIADNWKRYFGTDQIPSSRAVGKALANIRKISSNVKSDGKERSQTVDFEKLIVWAETHGIGDPDEIRRRVSHGTISGMPANG
jgi:hypothetical protein